MEKDEVVNKILKQGCAFCDPYCDDCPLHERNGYVCKGRNMDVSKLIAKSFIMRQNRKKIKLWKSLK